MADEKSILVIDDDKIILDSLCEFLGDQGFVTTGAGSLKSGLAKLSKQCYSLVITEISLIAI